MNTFLANLKNIKRDWYIIDANNIILGRLATKIAIILRGKHKPEYTPHVDTGDYIIVINASEIIVTGNKYCNKNYYYHTGYIGGIKKIIFKDMIAQRPEKVIEMAVKGMLPRGPLGRIMYRKLKVYANDQHKHIAQQPKMIYL